MEGEQKEVNVTSDNFKLEDKELRESTFGEKAVGLTFNPSGDPAVNDVKEKYASVIDMLNQMRNESPDGEQKRLLSVAITEAQGAQMWAVKAITWKYDN